MESLKPFAKQVGAALLAEHPDWEKYFGASDRGDLEVAIPTPEGSNAGHLVVFTNDADIWIRLAPPRMCYAVESEGEMLSIVSGLLADQVVFVVTMHDDGWVETTLARPGEEPELKQSDGANRFVDWNSRQNSRKFVSPVAGVQHA
jgi:hypothetical protein